MLDSTSYIISGSQYPQASRRGAGGGEVGLDEGGEGLRGGVGLPRGRGAALAAVLADERAVFVHARCKHMLFMLTATTTRMQQQTGG